ncbi:class I SAM-dependent methyltransferase [Planctomycetes bacterium K23_9]|uniref:Bifunctional 3-demethylubiquinone-9 3-methyltransferase/ 2-octaprenyl-6-hydroxy phenol methylase n=1 Tax=Stieleria marina TaxID=1930275 RepID=A0A517NNN8_9BACT|nr:bifunctional 3-demethylubiquinone-9 3-methyltransferase/ 2-octaprenyl-6-hydroxy phenol methylase [Planctomycetes bacterium K23_9]
MTDPLESCEQDRFAFGKNWQAFLTALDESRIEQAVASLVDRLGVDSLEGTTFLDIGSGSGLFSLAAHRLGAHVTSIDYDTESVACTNELKHRFACKDAIADETGAWSGTWTVQQGSVLDEALMDSLGEFDVVYSWGVLHHTGEMQRAVRIASERVSDGGKFFIAIYNDQGGGSRRWLAIKKLHHALPQPLRVVWVLMVAGFYELLFALSRLLKFRNPLPFADWGAKKKDRGMSVWHDWVDWIGGLPFQVATPEAVILPLRQKGFVLDDLVTVRSGWGCNEYVFSLRRDVL